MKKILKYMIPTLAGLLVVLFFGYAVEEKKCIERAEIMSVDYKYDFYSGCFVYYKYEWVEYNKLVIYRY